jgi:hypothetical protein
MTLGGQFRSLRRTATPYIGQAALIAGTAVLAAVVAISRRQPEILWSVLVLALLFAVTVYFGLRYRIEFSPGAIRQIAAGLPVKTLSYSDIRSVRLERATASQIIQGGRPFRRLAVYSNRPGDLRPIDVSLRHFRWSDIHDLLQAIKRVRPDLVIPAIDGHYWSPA